MTAQLAAFIIAAGMSAVSGFLVIPFFRKLKTGVDSRFLADRKKLDESVKTTGGAFIMLCGIICASAVSLPLVPSGERKVGEAAALVLFCIMLCLAGFAEDRLTDIKGFAAGLKPGIRILLVSFCGLVFASVYLVLGGNTVIGLPFSGTFIRTGGAFCIIITLLTAVICEFGRLSDKTEGVCTARDGIAMFFGAALSGFSGNAQGTVLWLACAGAAAGLFYWNSHPAAVKLGAAGRYLTCGAVIGCCIVSGCEGYLVYFAALPVICGGAIPVDRAVYRLSGRHIFKKLPPDVHLKSCGWKDRKITLFFAAASLFFSAAAATEAVIRFYSR